MWAGVLAVRRVLCALARFLYRVLRGLVHQLGLDLGKGSLVLLLSSLIPQPCMHLVSRSAF
jgi:hypothetical protein